MSPGDAVIVFVPDDLHARVAAAALERRLHGRHGAVYFYDS